MSLINWKIGDLTTSNKNFSLNISANGFGIIIDSGKENCLLLNIPLESCCALSQIGSGLNDGPEEVFIYNESSFLINNMSYNKNLKPSGKSWQFCSNSWLERNPTPATENNCSTTQINPPQNKTQNPIQNNTPNQESSISLDIDWNEEDIINGGEFGIDVEAYNLKDKKYDVKVWIEFEDNDTIISQTYDENDEWISSDDYYNRFFENVVNKTKEIKLRIKEDYKDYYGDCVIKLRLRETGSSSYIKEISKTLEVLEKGNEDKVAEKKEEVKKNNTEEIKTTIKSSESTNSISGNVIKLGGSESKETITNNQKNTNSNIIYQSKTEKMKVYAIIGFAALCLGLAILMVFKKIK